MTELTCTPGQTVGPFFGLALPYTGGGGVVHEAQPEAVRLHGTVYDGAGDGVPDALVELGQPDGAGRIPRGAGSLRRDGAGFTGFGRAATDADGHYGFTTVTPGCASRRKSTRTHGVSGAFVSARQLVGRPLMPAHQHDCRVIGQHVMQCGGHVGVPDAAGGHVEFTQLRRPVSVGHETGEPPRAVISR